MRATMTSADRMPKPGPAPSACVREREIPQLTSHPSHAAETGADRKPTTSKCPTKLLERTHDQQAAEDETRQPVGRRKEPSLEHREADEDRPEPLPDKTEMFADRHSGISVEQPFKQADNGTHFVRRRLRHLIRQIGHRNGPTDKPENLEHTGKNARDKSQLQQGAAGPRKALVKHDGQHDLRQTAQRHQVVGPCDDGLVLVKETQPLLGTGPQDLRKRKLIRKDQKTAHQQGCVQQRQVERHAIFS
jgi:hypothetical protein